MRKEISGFVIGKGASHEEALRRINENAKGFVVVTERGGHVAGTLTDGDIRRALLEGKAMGESIDGTYSREFQSIPDTAAVEDTIPLFKNNAIDFLPILDGEGRLSNIITKRQLHSLLLQDIKVDLSYDFMCLDENLVEHEIFERPWGFYKTTVMNDYFQSKVIVVKPGESLSLQKHKRREEHWIVAHGQGIAWLEGSSIRVCAGSSLFIPKNCLHRLCNTSDRETLILTEVQLGDYFGEDDIIRYDDIYGRVQ